MKPKINKTKKIKKNKISKTKINRKKYTKNIYYGGNNMNSIIIVGSGPTGLFTAIFVHYMLLNTIANKPSIIIYGDRLNDVGRLRQVIILKKEYGMVQKLFEIPGLVEFMADYIECVLYQETENPDYVVGPLLCNDKELFLNKEQFLNNQKIKGVTITIYNIEKCLIEFIKRFCPSVEFVNEKFIINNFNNNKSIIFGCSGALGEIRHKYTHFPNIKSLIPEYRCFASFNSMIFDKSSKLYENYYAGSKKDSLMLILRYPIVKQQPKLSDIAFAHPLNKNKHENKTDNIMISNYVTKNKNDKTYLTEREKNELNNDDTIFYRQIYYLITIQTFKQLSDCGFWNSCSLNDYFSNRTTINKIIPNDLQNFYLPSDVETTNININKIILDPHLPNIDFVLKPLIKTNKKTFLFRQVEVFTTKNLIDIFSKGMKVLLKKGKINRPYIDVQDESVIEITVDAYNIVGYVKRTFNELYFQLVPKEDIDIELGIDEVLYLYKPYTNDSEQQLQKRQLIINKMREDIEKFDGIKIDNNDFLKNTELIRIWTTVRFASKMYQDLNGNKTAILGDEGLLVNPMTGRGVSGSILSSYNFINYLSNIKYYNNSQKYNNIEQLIENFDRISQDYQRQIFYPSVCDVLIQGEKARKSQYVRHDFV